MDYSYFGFSGTRAKAASFFARRQGATQEEVNKVMAKYTPQKGFYNMLDQANEWGHRVVTWDDPTRGGKVFKLVYDRHHRARRVIDPPANWRSLNEPDVPPGTKTGEYRRERR